MFSSLAPARRRLALAVVGLLVLAVVAVLAVAIRPGHRSDPPAATVAQDRPGPILLVPGYGGSTSGLAVLAGRLRAAGRDASVVALPDNAEGDLSQQARMLGTAVRAALSRTGAGSVDVVGYSAGGVVARLWLQDDGGAALARRVVTLGSPQHGTALAALGSLVSGACPVACQQLVPTSPLLAGLNGAPALPRGPAFVSIWSSQDEVVLPPSSAVLPGALNIQIQQVCSTAKVSHSQLPTDPLVAAMVAAELTSGPTVPLAAADCGRLSRTG